MFSKLSTHFGIPGVIAVIALVFAMLGGAYAAKQLRRRRRRHALSQMLPGQTRQAQQARPRWSSRLHRRPGETSKEEDNETSATEICTGEEGSPGPRAAARMPA